MAREDPSCNAKMFDKDKLTTIKHARVRKYPCYQFTAFANVLVTKTTPPTGYQPSNILVTMTILKLTSYLPTNVLVTMTISPLTSL